MRLLSKLTLMLLISFIASLPALAQEERPEAGRAAPEESRRPSDPMSSATFAGLRLRLVGPALISGRVVALAVDPHDRSRYYVAAASGGVWKTANAGTTWTPVFDNEGSYSIGALALDPKNPSTVWVGTGENNSQRSVSYGDGIYRSDDGGRSWRNLGLKKSEHIARIIIDPRNSDVVYVAAQGPLWGPGGDRGLFKTTDGGKTWKPVLSISEHTGATDLVMDPRNPDLLYAASYQRRRHIWTLINGGPESAIYKSTDAGATWTKLRAGLPNVELGRIGLAISPANPDVIYATIEAANRQGGIFCSTDRGATWERRNPFDSGAMYYGKIFADPKNVDRIYVMNVQIQVSDDGGRNLRPLGERSKHVDNHIIWIDPEETNYYLVGCDGGVYESFDRGANWAFKANLPLGQFYDVGVDNAAPFYHVYGGTQDNFSLGGPARTRSNSGITNSDWFVTNGGDGFRSLVDPEDPNTIYAESQNGGLVRFDRRTGERITIRPLPGNGEEGQRTNWDTPFIISPHSRARLYYAGHKLFRSDNRGDDWRAISGDLTRQLDRNALPVMGKIWGPDAVAKHASTALYGNASALAESPKKEGLIYVGTDDGLMSVTENGGANWRKIDKFPGVPDHTYVSRITASLHDANTVYAAFDNHQNADFAPYLLKSTDAGQTWTSIKGNLPERGSVYAIAEDHVNPNLLFVGTEFGLFFTVNGGEKWIQLRGGLPTIAVRDLAIQRRENDLVLATFGRGIYVLDDYSPLRQTKPETLAQQEVLFPVKDALMYARSSPLGGNGKAFQGESFFTAPNPPYGATITYYLKESPKTKRQMRVEAEREANRKGQPIRYPTREELRAEQEEEPPAMMVTITDADGKVVRRLNGPVNAGLHRVTWDFRYSAPIITSVEQPPIGGGGGGGGRGGGGGGGRGGGGGQEGGFGGGPAGHLVMPGKFTVSLARKVNGVVTPLAGTQSFLVAVEGLEKMAAADRAALAEFQQKVSRLQRAVTGALETATTLKTRLGLIKRALDEAPDATPQLMAEVRTLDKRADDILHALRGDRALVDTPPPSINARVASIASRQRMAATRPTQTQIEQYSIAAEEFKPVLAKLRALVEGDVAKLEKAAEAAGAPWTPGRIPVWADK
jgi:photosystem II stability/assembly factor-like uncharacterized protein